MVRQYCSIKIWCNECEEKTPHYPLLNSDEYIARWVCCFEDQHRKENNYPVGDGTEAKKDEN